MIKRNTFVSLHHTDATFQQKTEPWRFPLVRTLQRPWGSLSSCQPLSLACRPPCHPISLSYWSTSKEALGQPPPASVYSEAVRHKLAAAPSAGTCRTDRTR